MSRTMPIPIWVGRDGRSRVVVETPDVAKQVALARILDKSGYAVLSCRGPEGTDDRCALVEHETCNGVAGADVVVHAMRPQDPRNREVLRHILDRYPDVPIVVEAPRPYVERHPDEFERCRVVFQPMTAEMLIEAVEEAIRDRAVTSADQA
jgi:DNA-binding NtrC family response regulator